MKRSRELREVVLGLYRDWMTSGFPTELLSSSPDLTATLMGGKIVTGRDMRVFLQAERELLPDITPGPLVAFEEGTVGWVADSPLIALRGITTPAPWAMTIVFHREDDAWKIVYMSSIVRDALDPSVKAAGTQYMASALERLTDVLEADRPDLGVLFAVDGTVTLLFTDIESSTATNQALGDERWTAVLKEHNKVLRDRTEASHGKVVRFLGDGYMLAFPSAGCAVDAAVAIQRALRDELTVWPVRVRMGLHIAEPIREADDFFGRDVAFAARVGEAAKGDEILVSSAVKSSLEDSEAFSFDGPRALELKGFDGTQDVFAVVYE
jgi:class 3 adenylate cyclase